MGFFIGSNAQHNPSRGPEYYNDVKKGELKQKYESGGRNTAWYHVVLALGAVALIVGFFLIFG